MLDKTAHRWIVASSVAMGLVGIAMPAVGQLTGPATVVERSAPAAVEAAPERAAVDFAVVAGDLDSRIERLLGQMTLDEKVGQLVQVYPPEEELGEEMAAQVRAGQVGSLFYPAGREVIEEAQQIAIEESRLGIPLLIARDVIHGFRTVFPIPLGQAATWNPELIEEGARVAALEARSERIDWTFAPMIDICRDARWGRIAESLGEDPLLAGDLGAAMVRGFEQSRDGRIDGIVSCAKHFVGYGFSEGGRDYNRVSVSTADLHNIILPPFLAAHEAGCRTFMTTFSEVNGVPGTAHGPLLDELLKQTWGFQGVVVSDWASVPEMVNHGFAADNASAARLAINAGVDMDMSSPAFANHLADLVRSGEVSTERLDNGVRRVLRLKVQLAHRPEAPQGVLTSAENLEAARETVRQSVVLLENDGILPLAAERLARVAVIGPMADAPQQQLGCWSLDGKTEDSVTPLAALRERFSGGAEVIYAKGAKNTFSEDESMIADAVAAAEGADVALLFLGEDAVLSGEARCRASLDLPGVQSRLVAEVAKTGTPTVLVLLAGRPLTFAAESAASDAVMFAWHPGTMAGPALVDLLLGDANPSAKLPVSFPRHVGQTPIYYSRTNTGRPHPQEYVPLIGTEQDDLPGQFQYSSHYLDESPTPRYPFGYGLSYTRFEYSDLRLSTDLLTEGDTLEVAVSVENAGEVAGDEVVQLYLRDRFASVVRPIRELKGYRKVRLAPGESRELRFSLGPKQLSYYNNSGELVLEPGRFDVFVGGDSDASLTASFELVRAAVSGVESPLSR